MKKKAALLLAFVMMLSLLPMNVFGISGVVPDRAEPTPRNAPADFTVHIDLSDLNGQNALIEDATSEGALFIEIAFTGPGDPRPNHDAGEVAFRVLSRVGVPDAVSNAAIHTQAQRDAAGALENLLFWEAAGTALPANTITRLNNANVDVGATPRRLLVPLAELQAEEASPILAEFSGFATLNFRAVVTNRDAGIRVRLVELVGTGLVERLVLAEGPLVRPALERGVEFSIHEPPAFVTDSVIGEIRIDELFPNSIDAAAPRQVALVAPVGYTWATPGALGVLGGEGNVRVRGDGTVFATETNFTKNILGRNTIAGNRDVVVIEFTASRLNSIAALTGLGRITIDGLWLVADARVPATQDLVIDIGFGRLQTRSRVREWNTTPAAGGAARWSAWSDWTSWANIGPTHATLVGASAVGWNPGVLAPTTEAAAARPNLEQQSEVRHQFTRLEGDWRDTSLPVATAGHVVRVGTIDAAGVTITGDDAVDEVRSGTDIAINTEYLYVRLFETSPGLLFAGGIDGITFNLVSQGVEFDGAEIRLISQEDEDPDWNNAWVPYDEYDYYFGAPTLSERSFTFRHQAKPVYADGYELNVAFGLSVVPGFVGLNGDNRVLVDVIRNGVRVDTVPIALIYDPIEVTGSPMRFVPAMAPGNVLVETTVNPVIITETAYGLLTENLVVSLVPMVNNRRVTLTTHPGFTFPTFDFDVRVDSASGMYVSGPHSIGVGEMVLEIDTPSYGTPAVITLYNITIASGGTVVPGLEFVLVVGGAHIAPDAPDTTAGEGYTTTLLTGAAQAGAFALSTTEFVWSEDQGRYIPGIRLDIPGATGGMISARIFAYSIGAEDYGFVDGVAFIEGRHAETGNRIRVEFRDGSNLARITNLSVMGLGLPDWTDIATWVDRQSTRSWPSGPAGSVIAIGHDQTFWMPGRLLAYAFGYGVDDSAFPAVNFFPR